MRQARSEEEIRFLRGSNGRSNQVRVVGLFISTLFHRFVCLTPPPPPPPLTQIRSCLSKPSSFHNRKPPCFLYILILGFLCHS